MTSLADIRSTFLSFFEKQGHRQVESSSLVPKNDPTLMFTNSGMVQFKNVFTGLEKRDYTRATTSQKCVRAGGKHNDLDNVGYTARHHTFFEMLGNFSFGDYFKADAISFAWNLLTRDFGLPKDRLLVTVFHDDEEAAGLWKKVAGLPEERIIRIATSDNFWMMGPTGPCGPCSEIFYDHGPAVAGGPPGSADQDGDRFIEIWNLVFMQFEQFADGRRERLPRPSIDTGMGLERIGAVLQGKHDNYDTDLMRALIEASAQASGADPDGPGRFHHRVVADHLRSTAFLIADGVMPSNEGRGYVLRRIMRRAMRHAHLLGARDPLMFRLVPALVREMGQAFPELIRAQALMAETLELEETRFRTTLERGLRLLEDEVKRLPEGRDLPGEAAFRLYDTYGFPLDLTQDALREIGRGVDVAGFDAAMAGQRAKARAAWAGSGEAADEAVWFELAEKHGGTEFLGYDSESAEAVVLALVREGKTITAAEQGERVQVVLNQTPFYAESGGQVGDRGRLTAGDAVLALGDTRRKAGLFVHHAEVLAGRLEVGAAAVLEVDHDFRSRVRANHSATHLLNQALRDVLGDHVAQRGSLNADDRLRFDFAHKAAMSEAELAKVAAITNGFIRQNSAVETRLMTPDAARALGAQALFGEKYGEEVRVVAMGRAPTGRGGDGQVWSIELCGGTHVARTGAIGAFVITSESASAAGIRRIEALTGQAALDHLDARATRLEGELSELRSVLAKDRRAAEEEIAGLRRKLALGGAGAAAGPELIAGTSFVGRVVEGVSGKDLRALIDAEKARIGEGVVVLIAPEKGKAAIAAGVSEGLSGRISAVDLVRAAGEAMGGRGGGGRPDFAQGGAPGADQAEAGLAAVRTALGG